MNKKRNGFTLIELVIAIGIFSISIFSILTIFKIVVSSSADTGTRTQAVLSAESLMDEVISKSFSKPTGGFAGPFTLANRSQFDTVTDYNNLSITGISNLYGDALPGLSNYNATISMTNTALGVIPSADVLLITIQITGPNDAFTLKGYAVNTQ